MGERERGREGERERGREGGREGGREWERGREGGREGEREGRGRERGREGGREEVEREGDREGRERGREGGESLIRLHPAALSTDELPLPPIVISLPSLSVLSFSVALNAGLVGLSLTYTISLAGMFQYCVRLSAEVENVVSTVRWIDVHDFIRWQAP